jgi:electron transfer flavoprotein beta subunit
MKIVVCAKVVPVSDSIITLNSEGTGIDISNVKFDLNPYDEYAIEAPCS